MDVLPPIAADASTIVSRSPMTMMLVGLLVGVALSACAALAWHLMQGENDRARGSVWTKNLEDLWGPFVKSQRPLILSIEDPLFVEVHSNPGVYYRDRSINEWKDIQHSRVVQELSKSFGKTELQPSRYYTAFGEADAAFRLGQLLGARKQIFSVARSSQLSWQELADNNVVFVGVQNLFFEQLQGLPVTPVLVADLEGVRNTRPATGESAIYVDRYTTAPSAQGFIYALVTHLPGPRGSNEVESFTSVRSPG